MLIEINIAIAMPLNEQGLNDGEIHEIDRLQLQSLQVPLDQVRKATRADPMLSRVIEYTLIGWPTEQVDKSIKSYFNKRHELIVEESNDSTALAIASSRGTACRSFGHSEHKNVS